MVNKKICYAAGCLRPLPPKASKYCSTRCRNRISQQKKRAKAKGKEWTQEEDKLNIPSQKTVQQRRGKVYTDLIESELGMQILQKKLTMSEVAKILRGKHNPQFAPHLDVGDYVVVINASIIQATSKKPEQKMYYDHSGYPGGLKEESFNSLKK